MEQFQLMEGRGSVCKSSSIGVSLHFLVVVGNEFSSLCSFT